MNTFMDTTSERSSLNILELGGRLLQLSRAKEAVALNSVHHVRICTAYDREEHVTVYVLDVFLQAEPRGLPKMTVTAAAANMHKQSNRKRRWREMREKDELHADYQVEHRYSAFRMLRERISKTVAAPKDTAHPQWCPYCLRVRELVNSGGFPSRFPNRGRVAIVTGLHKLLVRSREQHLEVFVNRLLNAAKDVSYRSGCNPCGRFEAVSRLLSGFLRDSHPCASKARGDKEDS
ncbi:unnamed protein product [Peronospora destructor]|uniref:PX domain-containing protein n=1 Tax=Peronospora destructor TaxID=86335 RepID=A0AAV0UQG9_9STRA|nr:unnamed protein product [Peronospora destructor]